MYNIFLRWDPWPVNVVCVLSLINPFGDVHKRRHDFFEIFDPPFLRLVYMSIFDTPLTTLDKPSIPRLMTSLMNAAIIIKMASICVILVLLFIWIKNVYQVKSKIELHICTTYVIQPKTSSLHGPKQFAILDHLLHVQWLRDKWLNILFNTVWPDCFWTIAH